MDNWRSYKFFDGWIMKKIEHTYNFNFNDKYHLNQPISECKYTYSCDSLDNTFTLCEETTFHSSEASVLRQDRRRLRKKKLVKKMRRYNGKRRNYSSSSSSDTDEGRRYKRAKYQRVFIHQKIIYDEYVTKKNRKFYPMKLKLLSNEKWGDCMDELMRKKEKLEKSDRDEKAEEGTEVKARIEKDGIIKDVKTAEESIPVYPPLPPYQPPLPPIQPPLPPPPPPPPPPPQPQPQPQAQSQSQQPQPQPQQQQQQPMAPSVRLVAVDSGAYVPIQPVAVARNNRAYGDQLPYGTMAGIAYEIPLEITYVIGCNAVFRQL